MTRGIEDATVPGDMFPVLLLSGRSFLQGVCDHLRSHTGADLVQIGTLGIAESDRIHVLAHSAAPPMGAPRHYDVCTTPCQAVLERHEIVMHLGDVGALFPDDPHLDGAQSYLGVPLLNTRGDSIGLLALVWADPLDRAIAQSVVDTIAPLIPRLQAEVARQNKDSAIGALILSDGDETNSDSMTFRSLVQQAAALAQVHAAVLAVCNDPQAETFRVLAASAGGALLAEAEGMLVTYEGAPCANLTRNDTCFVPRDVQAAFPGVALLEAVGAEAYCGFGFRDRSGRPIGHIAFVHDRPMAERMKSCQVIKIIAGRARQEIQRYVADSERRALHDALTVRNKMESLGVMAGTIAHDFNNQLTAIIGHTELALLELEHTHPAVPMLRTAEHCLWRARDVIGELMDFAGRTPDSPPEPVALAPLVHNTLQGLGPAMPEGDRLHVAVDPDLPAIAGRPSQIAQIVSSLARNALEATQANGGRVDIRLARVALSDAARATCLTEHGPNLPERCVLLEFADHGTGMDPDSASRVFDPYFSTKGVSRGLGLARVLGIARRMGAGLTMDTQPGRGTAFRLYFAPADAPSRKRPSSAKCNCTGQVLVVDDELNVLATLARQVERLGFTVLRASSGQEAVAIARETEDLRAAVLDVVMPGMSGWDTLDALRQSWSNLPAVMISGYDQTGGAPARVGDTRLCSLTKPYGLDALCKAMQQLGLCDPVPG